jgi:hypothetical protein
VRGHLVQRQRAGGIDDDALVVIDLDTRQRRDAEPVAMTMFLAE